MYVEGYKRKDKTPYLKIVTIAFAGLLSGFILFRIFISVERVKDDSMEPELKINDIIYAGRFSKIKPGDIVLVKSPFKSNSVSTLRVIAVEGQTVEIKDKAILVDGKPPAIAWKNHTDDKRIFPEKFTSRDNMSNVPVIKDRVFLMGDNQDKAYDSRDFGPIDKKLVIGVVLFSF